MYTTRAVLPVSTEMNCDLCHKTAGVTVATDILRKHDKLHATSLEKSKPVLCGRCHRQPPIEPLGIHGNPALPTLSRAMHNSHAIRVRGVTVNPDCYVCHPGVKTQCQRDIHYQKGMNCHNCHGGVAAVADPARRPWVDEPRCENCHQKSGFQFEQPGVLYGHSIGHNGIHCEACHGTPHAIQPTVTKQDNIQNIALQGHAGKLDTCTVCHGNSTPDEGFNHTPGEGGGSAAAVSAQTRAEAAVTASAGEGGQMGAYDLD